MKDNLNRFSSNQILIPMHKPYTANYRSVHIQKFEGKFI